MIVIKLKGGLGNQMFQYAYGLHLSRLYNCSLYLDTTLYEQGLSVREFALDIFQCEAKNFEEALGDNVLQVKDILLLSEEHFHFSEPALTPLDEDETIAESILVISGYWQSEKYFDTVKQELRRHFILKNPLTGKWLDMQRVILSVDAVMINVRRGDYLNYLEIHGVINVNYILKGIDRIKQKIKKPKFFIFSDDMNWCRDHLADIENVVFVDESYYDPKYAWYLQLMASCKYFIISNSTFAWWAAWLSSYEDKIVIAPSRWFTTDTIDASDLLPTSWIKI